MRAASQRPRWRDSPTGQTINHVDLVHTLCQGGFNLENFDNDSGAGQYRQICGEVEIRAIA
jgi:hypothetical protein